MGPRDSIGGEEKGLDAGFILEQEPSRLDMGSDGKRRVKEDGSLTNGESWGWSLGGRPDQAGFVK